MGKTVKQTTRSAENPMKTLERAVKIGIKYGVSEIKLGEMHVIFGMGRKPIQKPRKATSKLVKEQLGEQDKAQIQLQFNEVSDDLETAHIEDPMAYEDAIIAGQLTDEKNKDFGPQ